MSKNEQRDLPKTEAMEVDICRPPKKESKCYCSVPQCKSVKSPGVSFHQFPKDGDLKKKWETILRMKSTATKNMRVCSKHFQKDDFFPFAPFKKVRHLKPNRVPSFRHQVPSESAAQKAKNLQRLVEAQSLVNDYCTVYPRPTATTFVPVKVEPKDYELEDGEQDDVERQEGKEVEPVEDKTGDVDPFLPAMFLAETVLRTVAEEPTPTSNTAGEESTSATTTTSSPPSEDKSVEANFPAKIPSKFFLLTILNSRALLNTLTGLHSLTAFDRLVECVSMLDKSDLALRKKEISLKNRVLVCLMKLRQNLSFSDLAPLFNISRQTCVNYFKNLIPLLSIVLENLIPLPDFKGEEMSVPKEPSSLRIILGCADTNVEPPLCVKCRIHCYSSHKKKSTIKWMIGVAPNGQIEFISSAYGGRASEKFIVSDDGVLDKLEHNSSVVADRALCLDDECLQRNLQPVHAPPHKGKGKPSKEEAPKFAEVTRARVQVKRVIQRMKEFAFLSEQMQWTLTPYFDNALVVIAGIVNLSAPPLS